MQNNRSIDLLTQKFLSSFTHDTLSLFIDRNDKNKSYQNCFLGKRKNRLYIVKENEPITLEDIHSYKNINIKQAMVKVFISLFKTFEQFNQHCENIPWGTHVWIAEASDHMIHFNGDKLLGPRLNKHI
jgi:hypothetical protein